MPPHPAWVASQKRGAIMPSYSWLCGAPANTTSLSQIHSPSRTPNKTSPSPPFRSWYWNRHFLPLFLVYIHILFSVVACCGFCSQCSVCIGLLVRSSLSQLMASVVVMFLKTSGCHARFSCNQKPRHPLTGDNELEDQLMDAMAASSCGGLSGGPLISHLSSLFLFFFLLNRQIGEPPPVRAVHRLFRFWPVFWATEF